MTPSETGLRAWFAGRSRREKRLLLAMLALAALTIVWAGIILPVGDGLASSRERYRDAITRLGRTQAVLDAVRVAERERVSPLNGAFDAAVRASADQAGFTLQTLNAVGPDRVQAGIASAKPAALFGWVARAERAGILVAALSTTDNGDGTVAAQMTLAARRS